MGTKRQRIKVMPEMIRAAAVHLWDEQVAPSEDRDGVLAKIYRSMEIVRRRSAGS
jgi:hypothetical protein